MPSSSRAFDKNVDFVADLDVLMSSNSLAGDDAFALVADVHEDFLGADFDDVSFDDAALAIIFDRVGDQFLQFCHNGHVIVVVLLR